MRSTRTGMARMGVQPKLQELMMVLQIEVSDRYK